MKAVELLPKAGGCCCCCWLSLGLTTREERPFLNTVAGGNEEAWFESSNNKQVKWF